MKIISFTSLTQKEVAHITSRQVAATPQIQRKVLSILKAVRTGGHKKVLQFAKEYDGLKGKLDVSAAEVSSQAKKCSPAVKKAINIAIKNVRTFHLKQKEISWQFSDKNGVVLGQNIRAMDRVGVYVPGGAGKYPSTLIMNAVPAQIAGVKEIVMVTPAGKLIAPEIAYALKILKIHEAYKIGGAQSIAMLAYGTEKVKRVDKIVGPGNSFVAAAKKEVFGLVDIDMIAGPSEILVLCDETADPDWVAADLLSQAEHGSGYEAAVCITTSAKMAAWVAICVDEQVAKSPKRELLKKALSRFGRIFVVKNWKEGCALADHLAPEHLEIIARNGDKLASSLRNAGAVFIGPYSSEPVGDYMAGPNHVLPTNGSARFFSPLGVYDFYKRTSIIRYNQKGLQKIGKDIIALAEAEGFIHHAEAVRKRL